MGDRLAELRRQRALISEHLAWLDREIERLGRPPAAPAATLPALPSDLPVTPRDDGSRPSTVPPFAQTGASATPLPEPVVPNETADAEAARLMDEYRSSAANLKSDVRKGCLLYFISAFALLAIGIAILYFTIGSR